VLDKTARFEAHRPHDGRGLNGLKETRLDNRVTRPISQTTRSGAAQINHVPRDLKNVQPLATPTTVVTRLDTKTPAASVAVSAPMSTAAVSPAAKIDANRAIGRSDHSWRTGRIDQHVDKAVLDRHVRDLHERWKERLERVGRLERPGNKPKGRP
jgi:hypothetical protein